MVKKIALLGIIVMMIAALVGCNTSNKVGKSTTTTTAKKSQEADEDGQTKWKLDKTEFPALGKEILAKNLAKTKKEKVKIGGKEREIGLTLYDSKAMKFAFYLPDDMVAKAGFIETGNLLYVFLNPKGKNGTNERVEFFAKTKDAETTIESVTQAAKGTAVMNGLTTGPATGDLKLQVPGIEQNYSTYGFKTRKTNSQKIVGSTWVFEHDNQIYRITVQGVGALKGDMKRRVEALLAGMVWYN